MFGAATSLLFNVVGSLMVGQHPLKLIQVYLTFGNGSLGTFKFGRDFGLFAFDAIINDMSLIGAGSLLR